MPSDVKFTVCPVDEDGLPTGSKHGFTLPMPEDEDELSELLSDISRAIEETLREYL